MKEQEGFSLVELLMVVCIVGIISAIAIPGLRRARQYAESGSAIQSLRTITTAEMLYERRFKAFAVLVDLAPEGTIDPSLGAGIKSEYVFDITLFVEGTRQRWSCTAVPELDPGISDYFFVDDTAVIRFNKGAPADKDSDPIPR